MNPASHKVTSFSEAIYHTPHQDFLVRFQKHLIQETQYAFYGVLFLIRLVMISLIGFLLWLTTFIKTTVAGLSSAEVYLETILPKVLMCLGGTIPAVTVYFVSKHLTILPDYIGTLLTVLAFLSYKKIVYPILMLSVVGSLFLVFLI